MAVAGLPNLSVFDPSSGERQHSPSSSSTRASTLLHIWREIEGEHMVSQSTRSRQPRNGSDSWRLSTSISQESDNGDYDMSQDFDESKFQRFLGLKMEHEDSISSSPISEQSGDLGEIERERVRRIFREWKSNGSKGHSSCEFDISNRSGQWLGENECERVRIIREWMQMNNQQGNSCESPRDGVLEIGSQIDEVRDGNVISHPDTGARRPIRRLCGRQTLVDLLVRAQTERKRELIGLSEQRPVSDFCHRNRIQALLRGRFLRNDRLDLDKRPSSVSAIELDVLRQRQTVSDRREEFLSRLDSAASSSVNCVDSVSEHSCENNEESESIFGERVGYGMEAASDSGIAADQSSCVPEFEAQITESDDPVLDTEVTEQEVLHGIGSTNSREELPLDTEARQQEVAANGHGRPVEQRIQAVFSDNSLLDSEETHANRPPDVHDENNDRSNANNIHDMEINTNGEFDSEDVSALADFVQESIIETDDEAARSWQEDAADQWSPETSHNNVEEQEQMQESPDDWPSHDLPESIDSWLNMPSGEVSGSIERTGALYFSDDDNVQSIEIRELFSRRRVSSLLGSGFRDSLNQVLQSHVERLGHASSDWQEDNTSPVLVEQEQEQLNGDQNSALSDGDERIPFAHSTFFASPRQLWDVDLQTANWPHHISNEQLETEWEVINELRVNMARLQQRMNDMQSILEACMDMQIELQRSVRQEVSAALNRAISSRDSNKAAADQHHDESEKWDHVRKGICCLCRDSKIDSLIYRCGHMCICSKCAENLTQHKGKCPMCQAPVVEVVRAYFVQE